MSQTQRFMTTAQQFSFEDLDPTIDFLEDRFTELLEIKSIDEIGVEDGELFITFGVQEKDGSATFTERYYVPRFTFSHLCSFLNIPATVADYFAELSRLTPLEADIALKNESDHLGALMEKRLQNVNTRPIFMHLTSDEFGEFPRAITSDQYVRYEDLDCVRDMNDAIEKTQNVNYEFSMAQITPYQIIFGYQNKVGEICDEEVASGLAFYNSESKKRSLSMMDMILRLLCTNGLYSVQRRGGPNFRISHTGGDFHAKRINSFNKLVKNQGKFFESIKEIENHNDPIGGTLDWEYIHQLPSEYLAMRKGERSEIVDIATDEGYDFTPWGLVQALTYKGNHLAEDGNDTARLNEKATQIVLNAEDLTLYEFPEDEEE